MFQELEATSHDFQLGVGVSVVGSGGDGGGGRGSAESGKQPYGCRIMYSLRAGTAL